MSTISSVSPEDARNIRANMDGSPDGYLEMLVDGLPHLAHRAGGDKRAFVDERSRAQAHWPHSLGNFAVNSAAGQLTHIPAG